MKLPLALKPILLLLFLAGGSQLLSAQQPFPERCLGVWEGMMYMHKGGTIDDSVAVTFTVAALDDPKAWTWKMAYKSAQIDAVKDYVLRLEDPEKGIYLTDEGDGIILYDYLFGDKLYSVFSVKDQVLTASYELRGDVLVFEVTAGKQMGEAKGEYEIATFSVDVLQRVELRRRD